MKRRKFMLKSALTTAGLGLVPQLMAQKGKSHTSAQPFNLNYAPHLGMFKNMAGEDPIDQLNFMADHGFKAFEDNGMKGRDKALQEKMASTMSNRGMAMGVFVAHSISWKKPNLANGDIAPRKKFLAEIEESVEVAKRVNATWMTVVPGHTDPRLNISYQTAHVVESLKRASDILEPHGLVMVLEPLNFRDHPGLFLTESPQTYEICKAVDSPACKILFDIYHQQIQEGNLIPNIEACWDEIAYFQIGDNPGRNEPTTGEINYKNIFKHIHQKGFKGILGMEHGNSQPNEKGEKAVIEAYRTVDNFL
ncbi:hydroxypyruvate isomerase family protein [Allomuricauda sp. SCSIO 65647]|uniref:hydroxypyruvate isomerase family protein n=1 Tax=Allomuricauda sp. SCSIO 65647 TaxID=2908843 RepID=UPI001F431259|nr:TIM barrel protein [Muricauda sp. SCSIO 65647]UJH66329.1 TIM barrel protein [Muricauda sp. SCSIO 65647]